LQFQSLRSRQPFVHVHSTSLASDLALCRQPIGATAFLAHPGVLAAIRRTRVLPTCRASEPEGVELTEPMHPRAVGTAEEVKAALPARKTQARTVPTRPAAPARCSSTQSVRAAAGTRRGPLQVLKLQGLPMHGRSHLDESAARGRTECVRHCGKGRVRRRSGSSVVRKTRTMNVRGHRCDH